MKPMLASDFRKKVHMIPESQLDEFLEKGYEAYLPDDMSSGKAPTDDLVSDFIAYRKYAEELKPWMLHGAHRRTQNWLRLDNVI